MNYILFVVIVAVVAFIAGMFVEANNKTIGGRK